MSTKTEFIMSGISGIPKFSSDRNQCDAVLSVVVLSGHHFDRKPQSESEVSEV